ncbi:lipid kinase, YegS/Rv2252/BmrU family [Marinitoga hydrogenitolerans DSM 16785]|uniref:Lipid kinase, YegS/Rv2252/BmrU family n=1 Tax=Marinitoga hydrogenitolerans (strain DSM 16785 / JCM 12826 / AT1271) TaxID=1122195 RepID=A0A1M5AJ17_MARH1|nr:diacylglycerol kinase family protein [Marinitoga hydrogenitolerans]SHF29902.1 lipid kinase, YegS/Rv2252/BmrU family [Marinitoga hydrogenitolerans DSM 16785]
MKEYFFIVNPHSSGSKAKRIWPLIKDIIEKERFTFDYKFTEGRMHAYNLTIEAIKNGYKNIIGVGGDGTMNEIINGIFNQNYKNSREIVVGIIPTGTGNDWGKTIGIPNDYIQAIKIIKEGKIIVQDIGKVEYYNNNEREERYFANIAGMFFDAEVTKNTNISKDKNKSGAFSYLLNLLTTLYKYKSQKAKIIIDDKATNVNVFSMAVGICKYSGGGMMMVPSAIPDDGYFDITLIENIPKLQVIKNIKKIFDGSFIQLKWVKQFKAKKVEIKSKEKIYLEVDGESLGHSPFKFIILKKVLNVFGGE